MSGRMNVILVTCDCLRPDFIDAYGFSRLPERLREYRRQGLTPNMDALAGRGIVCRYAFAQGKDTGHSVPSMLSGRYPLDCGGLGPLTDSRVILPEMLKQQGYYCCGFNCNPWLSRDRNYDKGFDYYWDGSQLFRSRQVAGRLRYLLREPFVKAERMTARAVEHIGQNCNRPFFAWLHLMDTHMPYRSSGSGGAAEQLVRRYYIRKASRHPNRVGMSIRRRLLAAYQRGVEAVDGSLGRIMDFLQEQGVAERTAIVLTADHGEEFWEHKGYGHREQLYNELLHVPLILYHPGVGRRMYEGTASLLDVVPTVLETAGLEAGENLQGESIYNLIDGGSESAERVVISEQYIRSRTDMFLAAQDRRWKYIINSDGKGELYKLSSDALARSECSARYPEVARRYERILLRHAEKYLRRKGAHKSDLPSSTSADVAGQLRALGYME